MYFELLTSSCVEWQAVLCAGGRKGWGCCRVDQLCSLVWQGSADISVAPGRDCLHRELSNRRFRAAEADKCPQTRRFLGCTLLEQRVGECGKACLQCAKERKDTVLHSFALLKACTALGTGGTARCWGCAGLLWHRVLGPAACCVQ